MGYLVMIEKAMNSHNPLSLSMLESYWGALSPNCNQQGNTMILDSTILSCCLFLLPVYPVEPAKPAKYNPPAMRVRGVSYTKKITFPV